MADQPIYLFGRLNLVAAYENYEAKRTLLLRGLHSKAEVEVRGVLWSFLDVGETTADDERFAYGYLVKYRRITEEEVARPDLGSIGDTPIENLIVAKARFFLHLQSGVIAFHPVGGQVEANAFCDRFKRVFENEFQGFFVAAEIQMIQEQYKIFEVLSEFETVTKVQLSLHPSNPNLSEMWKDIDKDLKNKGVDSYVEIYEAGKKSPTLNIVNDKNVRGKIAMAEDGYGKAAVTGKLRGKTKTVTTRDNPVSGQARNEQFTPREVLDDLLSVFRLIFSRFLK
jgi:hypothetical protein